MCVCPSGSQSANIYDIYGEKRARVFWAQPTYLEPYHQHWGFGQIEETSAFKEYVILYNHNRTFTAVKAIWAYSISYKASIQTIIIISMSVINL